MGEIFSKETFASLGAHLLSFIKRFFVTSFFYCLIGAVFYLVPFVLCLGMKKIGVSQTVYMTILRVLLTIAPFAPTLACTLIKEEDAYEEVSMDLCFAAWIVTIIWAWMIL